MHGSMNVKITLPSFCVKFEFQDELDSIRRNRPQLTGGSLAKQAT